MRRLIVLMIGLSAGLAVAQQSDTPVLVSPREMSKAPQVAAASAETKPWVVPGGTKVPVRLESGISTKTARVGDAVYAQTTFPIAIDGKMMIPPGTYVQGRISKITPPGRVKGRAEILFNFTTLVFPNGYTVALPGSVSNVDSEKVSPKDAEGTIQQRGEKGKDVGTIASTGATGAVIGAAAGGGKGAGIGAGLGGATGLAIAMLTRGSEIRLPAGTTLEMIINRDLELDGSRVSPGLFIQRGIYTPLPPVRRQ